MKAEGLNKLLLLTAAAVINYSIGAAINDYSWSASVTLGQLFILFVADLMNRVTKPGVVATPEPSPVPAQAEEFPYIFPLKANEPAPVYLN